MELILTREHRHDFINTTVGKLEIDGKFICDTLEDFDRGLSDSMSDEQIKAIKIKGKTAIPTGRYLIDMDTVSPKFGARDAYKFCEGKLPRLVKVKEYEGILIHIGNSHIDTDGCILVGTRVLNQEKIYNSTIAFKKLYTILKEAKDKGEKIYITIKHFSYA